MLRQDGIIPALIFIGARKDVMTAPSEADVKPEAADEESDARDHENSQNV